MKTILNLQNCPESVLDNLPENMEIRGNLDLYATEIKSLPEYLKVRGELNLEECYSFKSLPKNLKVGICLNLNWCKSLKSLPKNLKVGSILSIGWCKRLKSLPEGLKVGKNLGTLTDDIDHIGFKFFPQDLQVGRKILIAHNCYKIDIQKIPEHLKKKIEIF